MQMGIVLDYWCRCSKSQHRRADSMEKSKPYERTAVDLRWWQVGH